MLFSIEKEKLSRLLYLANSIVEKKNTMPILANILLSLKKDKLQFSVTNLEVSLFAEVDVESKDTGNTTVDAKVFYEIVRELPNEKVTLKLIEDKRLEVKCGKSLFKINTSSADEFPKVAGITLKNPVSIDATLLYEMFDKTSYAVSTDEGRQNINGVYVELLNSNNENNLRFVSTDGHRLAIIERPVTGFNEFRPVIVPRRAIGEIKKILEGNDGAAKLELGESFITFESRGVTLGVRLVDGQYPDYSQVVPTKCSTTVNVNRDDFLAAIRRTSLMTTEKNKAVRIGVYGNTLTVSSSSQEFGEASDAIEVEKTGNDLDIGFCARYVQELLASMDSNQQVVMKLDGNLAPGLFTQADNESYTCIVMPMRFE